MLNYTASRNPVQQLGGQARRPKPSTMKAIKYKKYGSPEVFQLVEVPKPTPKSNEILIQVKAASINSWDWDLMRGKPFIVRMIGGGLWKPKLILGADFSGIVAELGKEVTDFKVGDEVYGDNSGGNWGGFAEFACADASVMAKKPKNLTFEEAAAVPQAGVLALQGLRNNGKIREGKQVLINGGGGGVGAFGIQLCKIFGATVIGVDNEYKLEAMKRWGASEVLDYKKVDFTTTGKQYDIILDNVSHKSAKAYRRALTENGVFAAVGGNIPLLFWNAMISRGKDKKIEIVMHEPNRADLDGLTTLFENGQLQSHVDKVFPLSEIANAFRYYEQGTFKGKIVIKIS